MARRRAPARRSAPARRPAPARRSAPPPSRSASNRSASTKANTAPPPATTPQKPNALTTPNASSGGGMMANIASAAAGSFIGSSLARAAFGAFGGSAEDHPQVDDNGNVVDANGQPMNEDELRQQNRCYDQSITFMKCLQQNGQENFAMCQYPYENMTNCQRLHYPQQFEEEQDKQESGFY